MQHLILEDRTLLPGERARGIYVPALCRKGLWVPRWSRIYRP